MERLKKYPEALIDDLSKVFALKDSNAPGYLSGANLTKLFNKLGFPDSYKFPDIGIVTPEVQGLSRTRYALKRLTDLNNTCRLPEALEELLKATGEITSTKDKFDEIFSHYKIQNPINPTKQIDNPIPSQLSSVYLPFSGNSISHHKIIDSNSKPVDEEELNNEVEGDIVFDEIPSGVKVVFISYSWDSDEHKKWVLNLANKLTSNGVFVLLDQYLPIGYPFPHFMINGIKRADKVIIVGSPDYKTKSIKSISGGVPFEDSIIHVELMNNIATTKFIPVIREGTFKDSLPSLISQRKGFNFGDHSDYDSLINEMVRSIHNVPIAPRPILGSTPSFEYSDLTSREKEALKSPSSDFRKNQDRKWVERLLGSFSFDLMDEYFSYGPNIVDERVFISLDMWNAIINSSSFRIYDPKLLDIITRFHGLWNEIGSTGLNYYSSVPGTNRVKFYGLQNDIFLSNEAEKAFNKLCELFVEMNPLLSEMARYIQDNFEIDVEETSNKFLESISK